MKNLLFLLIAMVISSSSLAQSFVKIDLPASMKAKPSSSLKITSETITKDVVFKSKDGRISEKGQVRMVIPDEGKGLISMEFTDNLLRVMKVKKDFLLSAPPLSNVAENSLDACLADCRARYTDPQGNKIKGRGACKFGCWFGSAKELAVLVQDIITTFTIF